MYPNTLQRATLRILQRLPLTFAVAFAALVVAIVPSLAELLQFDRAAIAAGEVWRMLTGHVAHWNGEHLLWDLLMFVVLGGICEWRSPRQMQLAVVVGVLTVTSTVFLWFPSIDQYRGLSGIDTGLFSLLSVQLLIQASHERNSQQAALTGALLFGLAAKIAYEAIGGHTIFVEQQAAGFVPLVWDHVAGAAAGAIVAARGGDPASSPPRGQLALHRPAA